MRLRTREKDAEVLSELAISADQLKQLFSTWKGIRSRCRNDDSVGATIDYGSRGIRMSAAWLLDFYQFARDMGPRPSDTHSVDRIDNNGNYEAANCRWATPKEQALNRRNARFVTWRGITKRLSEWAAELAGQLGASPSSIVGRIHAGWPIEKAFTTAVFRKQRYQQFRRFLAYD